MPQNSCEKYSEMIYKYTADMLDADEVRSLMRHIDVCPSCRSELNMVCAVTRAASEIDDVPVPDELISALDTRLEQTGKEIRKARRQGFGSISGTVLSLAAAAALAIGMYAGGVFDKYLHSDDVFDNAPAYTDSQNPTQTDNSDTDALPSDNTNTESADSADSTSGSAQSDNPNNSNQSDKSVKAKDNDSTQRSNSSLSASDSTVSKNQTPSVSSDSKNSNDDQSYSSDSASSENAKSDSVSVQSEKNTENSVSKQSAGVLRSPGAVSEGSDEGRSDADDYAAAPPTVSGSRHSSGGGSNSNSYDTDASDKSANEKTPAQIFSAAPPVGISANGANISVPLSCEVVTSNPKVYRNMYNVGASGKFSISADEWEAFKELVANNGDTLNIGAKTTTDPDAYISVRITVK